MPGQGKKSDNLNILEEIYHDSDQSIQSKQSFRQKVVDYFAAGKRIDKLLSSSVLILGLAAMVLGFFQFRWQINGYFIPKPKPVDPITLNSNINTDQDLLGLRTKDTDQDGLSDYDERKIYGSSPYLPDTDSDGVDDRTEITRKTDPTCPQGQNCFTDWSVLDTEARTLTPQDLLTTDQDLAGQLRRALIQEGLNPEELAQLDDQELMQVYQELVLQLQAEQPSPETGLGVAGMDLNNLSPAQVRELLKSAGVSDDIINQLNDQELMQLVSETLTTNNQATSTNNNQNQY